MNILHVYATFYPDRTSGVAECIRQLATDLQRNGAENRIFALSPHPDPEKIEMPEGEVVRAKAWAAPSSCDLGGLSSLRLYRSLCTWADIVHHHVPWPFGDLLHLLSRSAKPLVVTWHSDIVRQKFLAMACAPLRDALLRRASAIVATSPIYARTSPILSRPDVAPKVRAIPPGTMDQIGASAGNKEESEPFFLFLGALRYYKGLPFLIAAARISGAKVVLAGDGDDRELRRLARNAPNIIFAGHVGEEEKWRLLRSCRALVLPSHLRSEAYGMVLVEAGMCGKPMITCEIGTGTSFINVHEETGLVVKPASPGALAAAIKRLLDEPELCESFGHNARVRYEKLFDGRQTTAAHLRLYQDVLSNVR
jgi:rhamnosyl/mannosyltransferase